MIKNWQHLCIFGRIACVHTELDGMVIEHEDREIIVKVSGVDLLYIDANTGEILLIQGEDGFPTYLSDWAKEEPRTSYQIA